MTSAIIETGGKQYRVTPGQLVKIEKLEAAVGSTVSFDRVLVIALDGAVRVGNPVIAGETVQAEVVEQGKGKKLRVFTYKSKKRQRRTLGHRQSITTVRISSIGGAPKVEKPAKVAAVKAPAKKAVAKKAA